MKAKQVPGGLDEWLKTPTPIIGGINWRDVALNEPGRRANLKERRPQKLSSGKTVLIGIWSKLVPCFRLWTGRSTDFARPKRH